MKTVLAIAILATSATAFAYDPSLSVFRDNCTASRDELSFQCQYQEQLEQEQDRRDDFKHSDSYEELNILRSNNAILQEQLRILRQRQD